MKKLLLAVGLILAVVTPAVTPAKAAEFNLTNTVAGGDTIYAWPTNVAGTNGLNMQTGGAINLANYDAAGFYFSGYSTTNTNSTVTITLVRSASQNPPTVTSTYNAFETGTPVISIAVSIVGNGAQTYFTNLPSAFLQGAQWIGIRSCTNSNAGANGNLTNVLCGLSPKIIPIRYP
ncbi:MAG: hypothetical protein WCO56_11440 [Verrucomicrobiota bacterium]